MGWDDGDKGKNPWPPKGNKGPADLDAIVRDLKRKLAAFFGGRRGGPREPGGGGGGALNAGLVGAAAVVLLGIWGATGLYTVDAAERGVVLRFGEYQTTTLPGLHWHLPWPLEAVEIINTGATERWPYQGSMLTRDENIIIVDLVVQYRRTNAEAYLFSLRDPEVTMRDVTASAIREIVGKNDLDFILTEGRAEIASRTQELLQQTLDSYNSGMTVYAVNLQEANFPVQVEDSVQDAVKAREDRERRILEAETYSNDILPRARGAAARERENAAAYRARAIANAEGETDRFLSILTEYSKSPAVTRERLYLETLENVLSNSSKVLVDSDGGNNMLYLPLDQLRRRQQSDGEQQRVEEAPVSNTLPLSNTINERGSRARELR